MQTSSFANALVTLKPYQDQIETCLRDEIPNLGHDSKLRQACEYALLNGGKRFRPALVLLVTKALGKGFDATQSALAVEYFHTSTLIADDLPCMDNDDERRGKPTVHKVYGETVALLASYVLIAEGYGSLEKNARILGHPDADRICSLAVKNASDNGGLHGITGGQFRDLFPEKLDPETLISILKQKTVSLFEMSFVFGWLYGGGEEDKLPLVKETAYHFGLAFQIADDLNDQEQDRKNERAVNMANLFGVEYAVKELQKHVQKYRETLKALNLNSEELFDLTP